MPGYNALGRQPGAKQVDTVKTRFAGEPVSLTLHRLKTTANNAECLVLEHPGFAPHGRGRIYCDDPEDRPFATDATKFALFSAAAADYVAALRKKPDVVHLHDWHTGLYLLLREFDPRLKSLQSIRTVFTIHNLALQGVRPIEHDSSSLQAWYPELPYKLATVVDPRYLNCVNPMAIGIRLADAVNTVSPTYAREILQPGAGNGLEMDLNAATNDGRLSGILNGCAYPSRLPRAASWSELRALTASALTNWMSQGPVISSAHFFAERTLERLPARRPATLLTSVGRLTTQKAQLFLEHLPDGRTALEKILDDLGDTGWLLVLGSGDVRIESEFTRTSVSRPNLLFLNGFNEQLSAALYGLGDLFLMPSTFEPCGISQMLAMRAGQPCVVNDVGGLHDTVRDGDDGFVFSGASPEQQAQAFADTVEKAVKLQRNEHDAFSAVSKRAKAARFSWDDAASHYEEYLYRG
jgi:starch synthase